MATTHTDPITPLTTRVSKPDSTQDEDFLARVAWACITEPGDATRGKLVTHHGAAEALRLTLRDQPAGEDVEALRGRVRERFSADVIATTIARTEADGFEILTPPSEHWPTGLADLGDTEPVCLWVRGDAALLSTPSCW